MAVEPVEENAGVDVHSVLGGVVAVLVFEDVGAVTAGTPDPLRDPDELAPVDERSPEVPVADRLPRTPERAEKPPRQPPAMRKPDSLRGTHEIQLHIDGRSAEPLDNRTPKWIVRP